MLPKIVIQKVGMDNLFVFKLFAFLHVQDNLL